MTLIYDIIGMLNTGPSTDGTIECVEKGEMGSLRQDNRDREETKTCKQNEVKEKL